MKKWLNKIIQFLKNWGIFGIVAMITLYTPLWYAFIINDKEMISFGWKWVAIWALPFPPAWIVIGIIAGFYKWLWMFVILKGYYKIIETTKVVQRQNKMGKYFTSEEIDMFIALGVEIKEFSDKEKLSFTKRIRRERIEKIDEQWSLESMRKQIVKKVNIDEKNDV